MGGTRRLGASMAALALMSLTGMSQEAARTPAAPPAAPAAAAPANLGPQPVEAFAALPESKALPCRPTAPGSRASARSTASNI